MEVTKLPLLNKHHKVKYVGWVKMYMKTNLSTLVYSVECR